MNNMIFLLHYVLVFCFPILSPSDPEFHENLNISFGSKMTKSKYSGATYCAAINCRNNSVDNKDLSIFTFPADPARCRQWVQNCRREDLRKLDVNSLHKKRFFCAKHFEDDSFSNATKNRLKKTAVPTLFNLPNPPTPITCKRKSQSTHMGQEAKKRPTSKPANISNAAKVSTSNNERSKQPKESSVSASLRAVMSVITSSFLLSPPSSGPSVQSPSTATETESTDTVKETAPSETPQWSSSSVAAGTDIPYVPTTAHGCQTGQKLSSSTPRKQKLRQKKRALARKLHYTETKLKEVRNENPPPVNRNNLNLFMSMCDDYLPKPFASIVKDQALLYNSRYKKGFRYSLVCKQFALTLYYMSPKAYKYVRSVITLPCPRTLRKTSQKWKINPGFNSNVFQLLKSTVASLSPKDRLCTLSADEISLKSHLCYDTATDSIIGVEDLGKGKNYKPVTQAFVLMASGITSNWKQPVAYFLSSSTVSAIDIKNIMKEYVMKLDEIGLDVRCVVSDMGGNFFSAAKLLGVTGIDPFFFVGKKKIFYLFDVPHLIKCLRNNLMNYNIKFNGKTACWRDIVDFYEADKKCPLRLATKLTDIHINPNGFQKMKVKLATQVISGTVAACLHTYAKLGRLSSSALETADFLALFDKLFDVLNSSSFKAKKKFRRAFKGTHEQKTFLYDMLRTLSKLKLMHRTTNKDCTSDVDFITGWKITIRGVLDLWSSLQKEKDFKVEYLFTRRLNQDCLENFFSFLRSQNGIGKTLTSIQFMRAFKKAFCLNFFQKAKGSNCASDFDEVLLKMNEACITPPKEVSPATPAMAPPTIPPMSSSGSVPGKKSNIFAISSSDYNTLELPYANATQYVSGYLVFKCCKIHSCEVCAVYATCNKKESDETIFCKAKAYDTGKEVTFGSLKMPPEDFVNFIKSLEKIFIEDFGNVALAQPAKMLYAKMKGFRIEHPCADFPYVYMRKLFIRLRIFHKIREINRAFRKPGLSIHDKVKILQHQ